MKQTRPWVPAVTLLVLGMGVFGAVRLALSWPSHPQQQKEQRQQAEQGPEQRFDRTQVLVQGATCDLQNVSGKILVRPVAGRTAHLHVDLDGDSSSGVRVEISADPHGLRAQAVYPHHESTDVEVNYTLDLPSGVALKVHTVSGDIDVSGTDAAVDVHSVSGDIRLSRTAGELRVDSVSGDLELAEVAGHLQIGTVSGDVKGTLSAGSGGGMIHSVSGEVDLQASAKAGLLVQPSTLSGEVSSGLPAGGRVPLRIQTTSGDIRVSAR